MAMPQKFTFDVSFDNVEGDVPAPRAFEKRFSRAEIDTARQAARAEGHAAGLSEATELATSKTALALEAITQNITSLIGAQDAAVHDMQRRAIVALRAIVGKSLPALAAKGALAEVETFAIKCLHEAIDEPRLVVRVADEIYEPLRERIDAISTASGFAGRIVLLTDENLSGGDARVEWADGGAERDFNRQLNDIDAVLAERCAAAHSSAPISA
jgi:flagellar assembly protein FliH